ncbi:MAG: hypothetical protein JSS66_04830 [Armatimonadetes bacterium]|nr:hypothetical protein [Armatimonadota bacterium]
MIDAEPGTYLAKVYELIGSPALYDELAWGQTIKVTTGTGIVGTFAAETVQDAYFRFETPDTIFYVWAEAGLCLASEGRAHINVPADGLYEHDERAVATYLATVEVTQLDSYPDEGFVLSVTYDERRKALRNLGGALQEALDLAFYHHQHLGGSGHPSKILLSTYILLETEGPAGSTILKIIVPDEDLERWNARNFGIPVARLDDAIMDSADYTIDYTLKRIYLKNSLVAGSKVTILLPLSPQTALRMHEDSLITDSLEGENPDRLRPIYLTDGTTTADENGQEHEVVYTWDQNLYRDPQVYLDNVLADASLYETTPQAGSINFNPALDGTVYTSDSLRVVLTRLGQEVEGTISGERLEDLDAASVNRGTLDMTRVKKLDHVGLVRFKELAVLRPTKRLFQLGDGYRYYPEVLGSELQHATEVYQVFPTANMEGAPYLLSTRRGLMVSTDLSSASLVSGWVPDRGRPKKTLDNLLQDGSQTNHFKEIFFLSKPGRASKGAVFVSRNSASSWSALRMPIDGSVTTSASDFYASTQKTQQVSNSGLVTFVYSKLYYLGTDHGLWTASLAEGTADDDWVWSKANYAKHQVYALQEICTKNISYSSDGTSTESQDRSLYVGSSDGFYINGSRLNTDDVKGFYWVRSGLSNNQLFWYTDDAVYFTHTAEHIVETGSDGSGSDRWTHPLTDVGSVLYTVDVASTEEVTLPAVSEIDGVTLTTGDYVLLKDQSTLSENGVYQFDGVNLNLFGGSQLDSVRVEVSGAGSLDGSGWRTSVDSGDVTYHNLWYRAAYEVGANFSNIVQQQGTNRFFVFAEAGNDRCRSVLVLYDDDNAFTGLETASETWSNDEQDSPLCAVSTADSNIYVGSTRGIWRTSDDAESWRRNSQQFTRFDTVTTYDAPTQSLVDSAEFTVDADTQGVSFVAQQQSWASYLYERVYTDYYVSPWTALNADVVVYVNDEVATVPYSLTPSEGKISFTSTLSATDEVRVTIIRAGAYISNVGSTPHEELFNATVAGLTPLTTLSFELAGSALAGTEVFLKDRTQVPLTAMLLEFRYRSFQERTSVTVDPDTNRVYLAHDRSGTNTFPADFTEVFLVEIRDVLGIEDVLSQATSNQTYHFNSLIGVDTIQMSMTAEEKDAGFYTNFSRSPGTGFLADRGPKSAYFFNTLVDEFDTEASSSTVYAGLDPSDSDQPFNPRTVYVLQNATQSGDELRIGTDQGIWLFEDGRWKKESDLGGASRVYFIEERDGALNAGTDNGLWFRTGGQWTANPAYQQVIFDRETGSWFDGTFEAFGKDDGLAFVWTVDDEPFTSDPFIAVAETRVYGLWHGKFIRMDSEGHQTEIDALYLCTENGLFGVTNGGTSGDFSAFLQGREMFGDTPLEIPYENPDGDILSVPVKVYKMFQALPRPACDGGETKPSIPVHILTNNGVYKVRNWRWCDPADDNSLDFYPESHNLAGLTCNCYALSTRACADGVEPLSKIFVGTDRGVYRSFNEGASYERCERVGADNIAVYDLQVVGDCIFAATELGIYTSDDDGDSWRQPDPDNANACLQCDPTVTNAVSFDGHQYLAQTFAAVDGQSDVIRLGAYLSVEYPAEHDNPDALLDNYVQLSLWSTSGAGEPFFPILSNTPIGNIYARDVLYPNFWTFDISYTLLDPDATYALVAQEVPDAGAGGTKVFRWHTSTKSEPYVDGKAFAYASGWDEVPGYDGGAADFFFRVYFDPADEPTAEVVNVDLSEGEGLGLICTDAGALTTDFKFVSAWVLDDSQSMDWGDPDDGSGNGTRGDAMQSLMNEMWNRTKHVLSPSTELYYPSWGSVFTFGTSIIDRTSGYTNNPDTLEVYLGGLFERGNKSQLNEAGQFASTTVFPQAVIESILEDEDWSTLVQQVVDYLNDPVRQMLRLSEIDEWFQAQPVGTRSDWPYDNPDPDVRIASIKDYEDVAEYVVTRWANSFKPVIFMVGDGDDTASQDAATVALSALAGWPSEGTHIVAIGTEVSQRQIDLKTLGDESLGLYTTVLNGQSGGDWEILEDSLMHSGANSMFESSWTKTYDFDTATWVREVQAGFTADPGSVCTVEYRFTLNRSDWSSWTVLENAVPATIDNLVYGLEFRIVLADGWDSIYEVPIRPQVGSLTYTRVTPGRQYLVTPRQDVSGMVFEYLLSPVVDVPRTARLNWGVVRGDSKDFADFESVRTNRKGCLPNRQQSVQFSPEKTRLLLNTSTLDNRAFQVLGDDGLPTTWLPDDTVKVYVGGIEVRLDPDNPFYTYDYALGIVYFRDEMPAGTQVRVTLVTPEKLYVYDGEPTTTTDGKIYRAVNGRWPYDAQVVVLVNGQIKRGGYWLSPEEGFIAFMEERERADIVTVYIQHAPYFRVGCEVLDYGTATVDLERFGLYYTKRKNRTIVFSYQNPETPQVVEGTLRVTPESATAYTRLAIEYQYASPDSAKERGSLTNWWRFRPGEDTSVYTEVDDDGFVRLSAINGFVDGEDYDNRTIERTIDIGTLDLFQNGDQIYVKVTPYDGFVYGTEVDSKPAIMLGSNSPPWVTAVNVASPQKTVINAKSYVTSGATVTAQYTYVDLDGGADQSIVAWYDRDSADSVSSELTLPAELVTSGKVFSFIVTPYDGENYGLAVRSDEVTVL